MVGLTNMIDWEVRYRNWMMKAIDITGYYDDDYDLWRKCTSLSLCAKYVLVSHLTSHLAKYDASATNFYVVQLNVASKCPDKMYVPISLTS